MNEIGVAAYARKLELVSKALGLLEDAKTKLFATENDQLIKIADKVADIQKEICEMFGFRGGEQ